MDSGYGRAESGQPRPRGSAPYAPGPLTHSHAKKSGLLGSGLMKIHRVCMWEFPGRMFKKWITVAAYS